MHQRYSKLYIHGQQQLKQQAHIHIQIKASFMVHAQQ